MRSAEDGAAEAPAPLTVGTAGHIDHGKTALVGALTGRDTDRLAEEKRRGISIELGFAELDLGERRLSLVDVPGHERFVRTMIAGASGIDLFLLVVAADDGVMPQTREHLDVLRALGVERGVVALGKRDLVDAARATAVAEEARRLVPEAPVVEVSARTGTGLEELRAALAEVAASFHGAAASSLEGEAAASLDGEAAASLHGEAVGEEAEAEPLLHVDRVFTIAGHGTVVTGTLWSGTLRRGDEVTLLPSGLTTRVRSIEVHDRPRDAAGPRQRVALNLRGVDRAQVARGDVVTVAGGAAAPTHRLDVEAELGAERRAPVHLGTREAPARVADLGGGRFQLRLEQPLIARRGDRVVVRRIAPPETLGGGPVLDAAPPRHGPAGRKSSGATAAEPDPTQTEPAAEPAEPGPLARELLLMLRDDGLRPRGAGALAEAAGAPRRDVERALSQLVAAGEAVRVSADVHYPAATYAGLEAAVLAHVDRSGSASIGEVRDLLGLSRKYAQALLEHLDRVRLLRREGDLHLRRQNVRSTVGRQGSGGPSGLQNQQGGAAHRLEGSIPSPPRNPADRAD